MKISITENPSMLRFIFLKNPDDQRTMECESLSLKTLIEGNKVVGVIVQNDTQKLLLEREQCFV